jgi:hypothetical protein
VAARGVGGAGIRRALARVRDPRVNAYIYGLPPWPQAICQNDVIPDSAWAAMFSQIIANTRGGGLRPLKYPRR